MTIFTALLLRRALVSVRGDDARSFLQNLITGDMKLAVAGERGIYAFLLTPQGKYLHDLFITAVSATEFRLDVPVGQRANLVKRLSMYKLRSAVEVTEAEGLVLGQWGKTHDAGDFTATSVLLTDGRAANLGSRVYAEGGEINSTEADYRAHCLTIGVPDPEQDFIENKTMLMDAGIDGQFGVSWTKGCFVGQEPTARMNYRGLVKRLLVPVEEIMTPSEPLLLDGKKIGTAQSDRFALIHRDGLTTDGKAWAAQSLHTEDGRTITPQYPDWWSRSSAAAMERK